MNRENRKIFVVITSIIPVVIAIFFIWFYSKDYMTNPKPGAAGHVQAYTDDSAKNESSKTVNDINNSKDISQNSYFDNNSLQGEVNNLSAPTAKKIDSKVLEGKWVNAENNQYSGTELTIQNITNSGFDLKINAFQLNISGTSHTGGIAAKAYLSNDIIVFKADQGDLKGEIRQSNGKLYVKYIGNTKTYAGAGVVFANEFERYIIPSVKDIRMDIDEDGEEEVIRFKLTDKEKPAYATEQEVLYDEFSIIKNDQEVYNSAQESVQILGTYFDVKDRKYFGSKDNNKNGISEIYLRGISPPEKPSQLVIIECYNEEYKVVVNREASDYKFIDLNADGLMNLCLTYNHIQTNGIIDEYIYSFENGKYVPSYDLTKLWIQQQYKQVKEKLISSPFVKSGVNTDSWFTSTWMNYLHYASILGIEEEGQQIINMYAVSGEKTSLTEVFKQLLVKNKEWLNRLKLGKTDISY